MNFSFSKAFLGAFLAVIAFFVLLLAAYGIAAFERSRSLEHERDLLREAGIPATRAEFAEWYTPAEDTENAAEFYRLAIEAYNHSPLEISQNIPAIGDVEIALGDRLPLASHGATMEHFLANQDCLVYLRQANAIDYCRQKRDYSISSFDEEHLDRKLVELRAARSVARSLGR